MTDLDTATNPSSPDKTISLALTKKQRQHLKSLAHHIRPSIQIGAKGLSAGVIGEIVAALDANELIKVQLPPQSNAAEKDKELQVIAAQLPCSCAIVARIGRNIIVFQQKDPEKAKIVFPRSV